MSIQKDVLESEAAQSSYRNKLKNETNIKMKELGMAIGARQKEIESNKPDAKE